MKLAAIALLASLAVAGCASTTAVTPIGNGVFLLGGQGATLTHSGSAVKVGLIEKAKAHCAGLGKGFELVADKGQDATVYEHSSAEIKFRCP